jgi:hypothetical protein
LGKPLAGQKVLSETAGFCREADKNCTLLGYYAASSCSSIPKLRNNLGFFTIEDGINRSSRNVGKELSLLAA